jgi:hypothetical protein
MGLDIRLPIGVIFTIYGLILVFFGLVANPGIFYSSLGVDIELRLFGVNIDLWWGAAMLVFGAIMGALALRASRRSQP